MVRILMHGCNGHMGRVIQELAAEDPEVSIAAGVDIADNGNCPFPVYTDLSACDVETDVCIDFSTAKAVDALLDYCAERKLPVVVCTTGLSEEQIRHLEETAQKTAVLRSANMSLGINMLMSLIKKAARDLGSAGFDIEIEERHHRRKLDAPSGTALALADSINEAMDNRYHYVFDRSQRREKRDDLEIGISALRGGTIAGEHEIMFAGPDEVVSFCHTAHSRTVFGKGAIEAARYLAGRAPGKYDMSDVISMYDI